MREKEVELVKTIHANSLEEFDKLYNSTVEELGVSITKVDDIDSLTSRFHYTVTKRQAEDFADVFMQQNVSCHCSDCPFLQVTGDARRRWFPCRYSTYGETKMDSPACEVFYREAIKRMREEANE